MDAADEAAGRGRPVKKLKTDEDEALERNRLEIEAVQARLLVVETERDQLAEAKRKADNRRATASIERMSPYDCGVAFGIARRARFRQLVDVFRRSGQPDQVTLDEARAILAAAADPDSPHGDSRLQLMWWDDSSSVPIVSELAADVASPSSSSGSVATSSMTMFDIASHNLACLSGAQIAECLEHEYVALLWKAAMAYLARNCAAHLQYTVHFLGLADIKTCPPAVVVTCKRMRAVVGAAIRSLFRHAEDCPTAKRQLRALEAERIAAHPRMRSVLEAHNLAHARALERFDSLQPGDVVSVRIGVTVRVQIPQLPDDRHEMDEPTKVRASSLHVVVPVRLKAAQRPRSGNSAHWEPPLNVEIAAFQRKKAPRKHTWETRRVLESDINCAGPKMEPSLAEQPHVGGWAELERAQAQLFGAFGDLFPGESWSAKHLEPLAEPTLTFLFERCLAVDTNLHRQCDCIDNGADMCTASTNRMRCLYGHWVINAGVQEFDYADADAKAPPIQLGPAKSNHGGRHRFALHPGWVRETVRRLPHAMTGCGEPSACEDSVASVVTIVADYLLYSQLVGENHEPLQFAARRS